MKTITAKELNRTSNWRIILYAKPGTGKTSSAKFLKGNTRILDLDNSAKVLDGLSNITIDQLDRSQPEEDMLEFLKSAKQRINGFDNLIIDNISSFEKDWFVEKGRGSHNGISNELQDYSQWTNYFSRIMTEIYTLPVNVLITAWETSRQITSANGQQFNQYAPEIRTSVMDGLLGLCDVVGRLTVNPKTGNRGVILQGDDSIYAKNRLDNRQACPINELFSFGGDQHGGAVSVPENAG